MKRRRIRKSTVIVLAFTLYSVIIYAYFIPRVEMSASRIWLTVGVNALIIVLLWWIYRRREFMTDKHK